MTDQAKTLQLFQVVSQLEHLKVLVAGIDDPTAQEAALALIEDVQVQSANFNDAASEFLLALMDQRDEAVSYALEMERQRDFATEEFGRVAKHLELTNALNAWLEGDEYQALIYGEGWENDRVEFIENLITMTGLSEELATAFTLAVSNIDHAELEDVELRDLLVEILERMIQSVESNE